MKCCHVIDKDDNIFRKMIKQCTEKDFLEMYGIINDAARKYAGKIPADRWHEPYMPEEELRHEIQDGAVFWGYYSPKLVGVMGIQDKGDVALIRHAYVTPKEQGRGIGGELIEKLKNQTEKPILVGTWKATTWAISFYEKHGFEEVDEETKNFLLRKYWSIPERQVATSTVLADSASMKKFSAARRSSSQGQPLRSSAARQLPTRAGISSPDTGGLL